MSLRPYKFVVQAICQQIDDDDNVTGESTTEPAVVFGCDQLAEWAQTFPDKLAEADTNRSQLT